jgi:hypothetical protein
VRGSQLDDSLREAPIGEDTLELGPGEREDGPRGSARRGPEKAFPQLLERGRGCHRTEHGSSVSVPRRGHAA